MNLYRRVLGYYRPYLVSIFGASVLLVLVTGLSLAKPWPVEWVVRALVERGGRVVEGVWVAALVLVLIHLAWGLFNMTVNVWLIDIGLKALFRLRTELYGYLQSLPLRFHDRRRSGDSTFRVAYDAQAIQRFFNQGFATVVSSLLLLTGALVLMFWMNWRLALVSLLVVPALFVAIAWFARRIRQQTADLQREESEVLSRASEGLSSIRMVHAFAREEQEVADFARECRESLLANRRLSLTGVTSTFCVGLITALGMAGLLVCGAWEIQAGRLQVSELWVFLAYLAMLYQPLEQLSYTAWSLEGAVAAAERVFEVLDTKNDVDDAPDARVFRPGAGEVIFDEVTFGYEPGRPILRNLSLRIEPGQTVALVGGTGAGKTSILSLLVRFYDVDAGRVLIDGQDVRKVTRRSLRENIGLVLQDTVLLNGSVLENIAYGRPGASRAEIEIAARAAQAHEFIMELPQGYDTEVGERGVRLSGGQRQRLGLARAFLKGSSLLLLDEPTSALDATTEREIMDALNLLMKRQTTVIVTHRLNTIHHVDQIYVLEAGRVVEQGTGEELLSHHGAYWRLWRTFKY